MSVEHLSDQELDALERQGLAGLDDAGLDRLSLPAGHGHPSSEAYYSQHPIIGAINKAGEAIQGVQSRIGSAVAPVLNSVSEGITGLDKASGGAISNSRYVKGAKALGEIGKFANGGNQELSGLIAEHGGMAGAVAGTGLSQLSSALLPTNTAAAAALPLMISAPEVNTELEELQRIKSGLENFKLNANGPADNLLSDTNFKSSTAQGAHDTINAGGGEMRGSGGRLGPGNPMASEVGSSPAEGLRNYLDDAIAKAQAKGAGKSSSVASGLYDETKGGASELATDAATNLLNWFPRIPMRIARKLASDPDMVNRALPFDVVKENYANWAEKHGLRSGQAGMEAIAERTNNSAIPYKEVGEKAYAELKNLDTLPSNADVQLALEGRQAIAEAMRAKWKNPSLGYSNRILLKWQGVLDDVIQRAHPDYNDLRKQYADSATVEHLNHVLPMNQNMSPNKLQLALLMKGAYDAAIAGKPMQGLMAGAAGLATSSPIVWKQGLGAVGVGAREMGMEGLANQGKNIVPATANAAVNSKKKEGK